MFTSLVIRNVKQVQKRALSALSLLAVLVISGCGGGSVPVIYVSPVSETSYTLANFSPKVEFPNGLPPKTQVEIRINGIVVTADFNVWGVTQAGISGAVNNGSYPLMMAAFRDGRNTFQVSNPVKEVIFFNMDLAGSEVHVTQVHDNSCGTTFITNVGVLADLNDGIITDFDCSNYYMTRCAHASNLDTRYGCDANNVCDGRDNLGNPIYKSILKAQCDNLQFGTALPPLSPTKPANSGMYIRGYFENSTPMTSMVHKSYTISTAGTWTQATSRTINYNTSVNWLGADDSKYYGHFGKTGVLCNGVTVDLKMNEFCMMVPDKDAVSITGVDAAGSAYTEWIRSDVALKDSRINSQGMLGLRAESFAMEVVLDTVSRTVSAPNTNLASPAIFVIKKTDPPPSLCIGCKWMEIKLTSLLIAKLDMTADFPKTPSGRLNMAIDLNCATGGCTGKAISGVGVISYQCKVSSWGITDIGCSIFSLASIDGPFSFKANASTNAEVLIALNPTTYKMGTTTNLPNFYLGELDLVIDSWVNGLVDLLAGAILPILQTTIADMIKGMVEGMVNQLFNKDLPLLRLAIPSVDLAGQSTMIYMALNPEVSTFITSENIHQEYSAPIKEVSGELALGLHATGRPRINQSIGSRFDSAAPPLFKPTTAKNDAKANDRNVGITLNETFVNQLFMGMWESGLLYIDFNAGNNPTLSTFMTDARITFASKSPWMIGHLAAGENAKGDVVINVNDLVIGISGDIYDPYKGVWLNDKIIFEMILELEIYADLAADAGAIGIDLSSNPTFNLLSIRSDFFAVDAELANSLLQVAFPLLINTSTSLRLEVPVIAGMHFEIGDIWIPDTGNLALTLDAWCDAVECAKTNNGERVLDPVGEVNFDASIRTALTPTSYLRADDVTTPLYSNALQSIGLESVFTIHSNPAIPGCIRDGDIVWLQSKAYGKFLTAKDDGTLTVDSTTLTGDNFFYIVNADGLTTCITEGAGSDIYLISQNTGKVIKFNSTGATSTATTEASNLSGTDNRMILDQAPAYVSYPVSRGNFNFMSLETYAFVGAQGNGNGDVRALQWRFLPGNEAGNWETFTIKTAQGIKPGSTCIPSGSIVRIRHNTYAVRHNGAGNVDAMTTVDTGTNTEWIATSVYGAGCLKDKDIVTFYNPATKRFMSTEPGAGATNVSLDFGDNIAAGKTATQSSLDAGGVPERAVDGNTSGTWGDNSTTHTLTSTNPWWRVDLGKDYKLSGVKLFNRTDCCQNRLDGFVLEYLNASDGVVASYTHGAAGNLTQVNLTGSGVRHVRVRLDGASKILSLGEVQVFEDSASTDTTPGEQFMIRLDGLTPNTGSLTYDSNAGRTVNINSNRTPANYMMPQNGGNAWQTSYSCGFLNLSTCWQWNYSHMQTTSTNPGGDWEKFKIIAVNSRSSTCLQDRDKVRIQVANGNYALEDGPGALTTRYNMPTDARSNFMLVNITNPAGCLRANDRVAFLANNNLFIRDNGDFAEPDSTWVESHEQWIVKGTVLAP